MTNTFREKSLFSFRLLKSHTWEPCLPEAYALEREVFDHNLGEESRIMGIKNPNARQEAEVAQAAGFGPGNTSGATWIVVESSAGGGRQVTYHPRQRTA